MKKALLFALLLLKAVSFAQDYKKEWIKVLEKESQGEIKQAAALTDIIYKKAKKDKNQPQLIKSFFFKSKYMQVIEEDAQFKIIKNIQAEIKTAPLATKAILNSLYAQMLVKIFNKNYNRIYSISVVESYDKEDYRLWGTLNFKDEIDAAFQASLENTEILYNTPLSGFDDIIDFAPTQTDTKRPLYDFLAEYYLDYLFTQTSMYDNYFTKNIELLFGSTKEYLSLKVSDSLAKPDVKAVSLLAGIENHFYTEHDSQNLQRAVLRRLNYFDKEISNDAKEPVYLNTIRQISRSGENTFFCIKAQLTEARLLIYQADKKTAARNLVDAVAILDGVIANKSKIDLSAEATNIKNGITGSKASIMLKNYILPNSPALASISFKNLDSISLLFYKIPFNTIKRDFNFHEQYSKEHKPILIQKYALPNKHDHFEYSTEIILPPLLTGTYAVVLSGKDLSQKNGSRSNIIYVSQLSIVEQECNNYNSYQVIDRISGKPVENVVTFSPKFPEQLSDKNGKIKFTATADYTRNYYQADAITFIWGKDTLSNNFYVNSYNRPSRTNVYVELYMDRQLYRPGQTVYFKGIAYLEQNGVYKVLPNKYFTIEVEDPRSKTIKEFRLKTNEFGSFAEKVELPKNTTGTFEITVNEDDEDDDPFWEDAYLNNPSTEFSVEDYKRPTFGVSFDKIKEDIRLNETVKVKGLAKAFSNAPLTEAEVEYTVSRYKRNRYYSYEESEEIITEDTETDVNGNFLIQFTAEPDDEYNKEDRPVFMYEIKAVVTDNNGETHTAEYTVYAGYHALEISADIPNIINAEETATVFLETDNLNGEFLPAPGIIQIYKVATPDRYYSIRPWEEPEIQTISEKEFSEKFPYIPYTAITDTLIKDPVYTKEVNTAKTKDFKIENLTTWQSGEYELVFKAKDSLGNEVSSKKRFFLSRNTDKIPSDKKTFDYKITNTDYAKDGYVEIELSSGVPLYVSVAAQSDYINLYERDHSLDTEKKKNKDTCIKKPTVVNVFPDKLCVAKSILQ